MKNLNCNAVSAVQVTHLFVQRLVRMRLAGSACPAPHACTPLSARMLCLCMRFRWPALPSPLALQLHYTHQPPARQHRPLPAGPRPCPCCATTRPSLPPLKHLPLTPCPCPVPHPTRSPPRSLAAWSTPAAPPLACPAPSACSTQPPRCAAKAKAKAGAPPKAHARPGPGPPAAESVHPSPASHHNE